MSGEKSPPSKPSTDESSVAETPERPHSEQGPSATQEMAEDAKEMADEAREQAEEAKEMAQSARDMAQDIRTKAKQTRSLVDDSITTSAGLMISDQRDVEYSDEFEAVVDEPDGEETPPTEPSPPASEPNEKEASQAADEPAEEALASAPGDADGTDATNATNDTDDASGADDAVGVDDPGDPSASFFEEGERLEAEGAADDAEIDVDELVPAAGMEDEVPWGSTHGPVVPPEWEFVLPLSVVLISWLVMSTFWDDVQYFFTSRAPISLGSVKEGCTQKTYQKMKHNRLAQIKGVYAQPGMTAQARVRFHQQNYAVAMGCHLILAMRKEKFKQVAESYFAVKGRLMRSDRSPATRTLEKYYGPSGILKFGKGTYLLYVDEHPRHQWWLVVIYLILGALVLYNAWRLLYILWHNHIKGTEGEAAQ